MRGPALSRAQDERVLLVKLGVVFRKVNQRLPCCRISGITRQWLHDTRALTRKLVVQSARSRRTHCCRLAVDGSTPKEGPQAKISPAPVSSVCDHEPSQGLLRSSIVVSILPGHCGRLIRQATRPLFPKDCYGPFLGFVPTATADLVCFVWTEGRKFPLSFPGVREGRQAAISLCFCRPVGDTL